MKPSRIILLISAVGWIVIYIAGFAFLGSSVPTVESSGQENVYLGGVLGFAFVVGLLVWALKRIDTPADSANPATAKP
jgi:hypothetical protein